MTDHVLERAPAKVNLDLRVGPPLADGYHPLRSIVVFADWADTITAAPAEGLSLSLAGPGGKALEAEPHNLVLKAAWALRAAAERPELGAAIRLDKRLPVAAGLGGGSADAAATLRALNQLWELGFSTRALAEIGRAVGVDVPACVHARPLLMTGTGETITPLLAWPSLNAVLANPGRPTPTGPVFAAYDETVPALLGPSGPTPMAGDLEGALAVLAGSANDLEAPAHRLEPAVGETLAALADLPGARLARMTGSGATGFALFETEEAAKAASDTLAAVQTGWTVRAVRLGGAA